MGFVQHYYILVFLLSTSAIMRQASVHRNSKMWRGLPDDGWCRQPKHILVLN